MFSSGGHLDHWGKIASVILIERHLDHMPVKFDWNYLKDIGGIIIKSFFSVLSYGSHFVHWGETIFANLVVSYPGNISVKFDWH